MKKSTKGVLASGAAAALLLGGAGTLAFWTATDDVEGGTITAGTLTLTGGDCTGPEYATGAAGAGNPVTLFVPGDKITVSCDFTIGATGDNLSATLNAPDSVEFDNELLTAAVDVSYELNGAPLVGTTITDGVADQTLTATFAIDIDYGTADVPFGSAAPTTPGTNGNLTQGITAVLDALTVTLTQDDPNA